MDDTQIEALGRQAFPAATQIIILDAGNPGGTLFHDADAEFQVAGIAATSWDEVTGTLYLRRLPPRPESGSKPSSLGPSA